MALTSGQSTILEEEDRLAGSGRRVGSALAQWYRAAAAVILGGVRHVEGNMVPVEVCTAIMFPAYWFVWKFLFPQPYENLGLRLFGSLLCLAVAVKDRWPAGLRRYLPLAWLGTVLYAGPFFFTFMLLQNHNSTIWLLSTMAGLFLVVLLLDWISLFVLFIAGSLLAWGAHAMLSPDTGSIGLYLEFVPIFLFALTAGTIFNYQAAGLRQAKERARRELGALLAKELQSPLISMRTQAASLEKFLPVLIDAYAAATPDQGAAVAPGMRQLGALQRVPARIGEAIEQMAGIIEVLMTEGGEGGLDRWRASSMQRCLDAAIARLSEGEVDRTPIVVDRQVDFMFHGSPMLMQHILARLLEASVAALAATPGAQLRVSLGVESEGNYLRLADPWTELPGSGHARRARRSTGDFADRPDLALADFVLRRMGGSVAHTGDIVVLRFPPAGG
jgi:signal transduction histidine kinase